MYGLLAVKNICFMEKSIDTKVLVKVLVPFHQLKKGDTKRVTKSVATSLIKGGFAELAKAEK